MLFFGSTTTTALLLALSGSILGANGLTITSTEQFISFANNVNSGTSYSGTTVFLGSDIDFTPSLSQDFQPIGMVETKYFQWAFDGKGYIIKNLALNSSSQFVGLFGYSVGGKFKNVVMDSSCSILNAYVSSSDGAEVGSIVGYCGSCTTENVVNMASIAFTGDATGNTLFMGGIISRLIYAGTVKNCVNYGSVLHSGNVGNRESVIGGIVGFSGSNGDKYVQNCANYGTITFKGTSSDSDIGGIIGKSWLGSVTAENCMSSGVIYTNMKSKYIGSIVGYAGTTTTTITHCSWTSDVGYSNSVGSGTATITDSSLKEPNVTTMTELKEYAAKNSKWSNWFILHLNGGKINGITQKAMIVTQKPFPDPVKEGYTFLFWCLNEKCTEKYGSKTTDINLVTELYAQWNTNEVYFDFGNGTKTEKTVKYGETYGTLPSPADRTGYTFKGWFTEEDGQGERITEETTVSIGMDHTLYAHWTINNYTITFVFNNGAEDEVITLDFNETIVYPEDPTKEGYTFNGWNNKPEAMPAKDIIVTAQWIINNYTITFVFNNGTDPMNESFNYNEIIPYPENVVKEGYTFNGWSPKPERVPAENVTVTAQWIINNYTITFIFDNGDENEEMILNFNEVIVYPEDQTKEGYTFNEWSPKPERIPAQNINTVAQWIANNYTVTFDFGNETISTETVIYDESYGTFPNAEKTGYTFKGWFTEKEGQGERITEETIMTIANDHTLYAHWTNNNYTITFVFDNGDENEMRIVELDNTIVYPENVVKEGHTFNGWSPKPERMPAKNVTVTAQWTINNYTITFVFNNSVENEVRALNYDEVIVYPENFVKEGYAFIGWNNKPVRMPAKDVTVTAQWIEKPSEFVEIVFVKKDLKEEEAGVIIMKYTEEEFIIERFEVDDETGETRVIAKFEDVSKAAEFVRNIIEKEGSKDKSIKSVNIVSENSSLSPFFTPNYFNFFLI